MARKTESKLTFAVTVKQGEHTMEEVAGFLTRAIEQEFPDVEIKIVKKETTYA